MENLNQRNSKELQILLGVDESNNTVWCKYSDYFKLYYKLFYNKMIVNVVNNSNNPLPKYADAGSSGTDVYADIENIDKKFLYDGSEILNLYDSGGPIKTLVIPPGGRALIPSGLHVAIPEGYEIQVRDRSGLALKLGVMVTNGIGTIDASYRGDIGIILTNTGNTLVKIFQGDRISQLVMMKVEKIEWNLVEKLDDSERGDGAYGHTGLK